MECITLSHAVFAAVAFLGSSTLFTGTEVDSSNKQVVTRNFLTAVEQEDYLKASVIWEHFGNGCSNFSVEGGKDPYESNLYLDFFSDILKHYMNGNFESPGLLKKLSHFVHISPVPRNRRADFYLQILELVQNTRKLNKTVEMDTLFLLGKFILDDKVETVTLKQFRTLRGTAVAQNKAKLWKLMPPIVWTILTGKEFMLKNVKYGSHLYVGLGKSGQQELLTWKPKQLTNKQQAVFKIAADTRTEQDFFFLPDLSNFSKSLSTSAYFHWEHVAGSENMLLTSTCLDDGGKNCSVIPEYGDSDEDEEKVSYLNTLWTMDLFDNDNTVAIRNQVGGLVVALPVQFDMDISRGATSTGAFQDPVGVEAKWTLISV